VENQFGKTDVPFFTGRLVGLRSFAVTDSGYLTGVTYKAKWTDGDNEAKCALYDPTFEAENGTTAPRTVEGDEPHQVASLNCSCGHYAYFDGNDNEFNHGVNVEGLIEAWGKVTIGEKGFRASQARIAALVVPLKAIPNPVPYLDTARKLLHRATCKAKFHESHMWSYPYLAKDAGCTLPLFPNPDLMRTIVSHYPTARIFESMDEAVKAFPVTPVDTAKEIVGA
jgi:hypothetical protein